MNPMSPRGKEREEENGGRRKRKRKEIGALLVLLFRGPRRSSKFLLSHAMQQCVQKCSTVDFFRLFGMLYLKENWQPQFLPRSGKK